MKKFTKLIALMLAILMLASSAVACNGNQQTPADTTSGVDTTGAQIDEITFPTPETITIEQTDYELNYQITRPENKTFASHEVKAAQDILSYLSEKIGTVPTITTDWERQEDSSKLEIIVGTTDHPETDVLLEDMSYGDYGVRAVGNKVVVVAFDEAGYTAAVDHLRGLLDRGYNADSNTITVSTADLSIIGETDTQLGALPVYEGGRYYTTYDAGPVTLKTDCDEIVVRSTTIDEYDEYLTKLEANGYTHYTTNDIGANNRFAIYTNGEYTINVGYYGYESSARLLVEPAGALPPRAEDNDNSEPVTTAQITMIAVSSGNNNNGLSILVRLEDGRFVVVDGGFDGSADHFIKTIKDQASEYTDKPVIAAWISTHPHGDHCRLLATGVLKIKLAGISVERIILNAMSDEEAKRAYETTQAYQNGEVSGYYEYGENEGKGWNESIMGDVAAAYGADVYKAHIGQAFVLSNCKIDILFTMEGGAPDVCNAVNTTSIVAKFTFTDSATGKQTTFLSTGDAAGYTMRVSSNIFRDYMKSEIITVNHHGMGTKGNSDATAAAYKLISPALVLWPCGKLGINEYLSSDFNKVLFSNSSYREWYLAGDAGKGGRDVVVPMPYEVGNIIEVKH